MKEKVVESFLSCFRKLLISLEFEWTGWLDVRTFLAYDESVKM